MSPAIRVLYAEDNPQDADLTRTHFAAHAPDFQLEIVRTGQQCLDRLRAAGADLLLLDHRLPDMDGLDVLRTLVHAHVPTPVVLVTGVGDEDLVVRALRLGAVNYVPKTAGYLETLPDLLRNVLDERRKAPLPEPVTQSPRRILYVEHHTMDIELTVRHFDETAPHFAVHVARTCAEALASLESTEAWDLVLIDLRMPDMNGLDFVREARRRRLDLPPFIIISGKGDDAAAIATLKLGAADYIAKRDGYLEQLTYTIEHALAAEQLRRLNRQLRGELTGRAEANRALQASEVRYRHLFQANPCPMWVYDLDTLRFLAVNNAALAHYGYSLEEFLAMTLADIRPPEDVPRLTDNIGRSPAEGLDRAGIWRHRKRNGTLIDVEITSHALEFEGRRAKLVSANDVTDRLAVDRALRASEDRFRATFEQAAVGIAHVAPDGRWLRVNQKVCDIVGYSREELLGRTFQDITHPDDLETDLDGMRRVLAGAIATYSIEKRYFHKAGAVVWIDLTVSLVRRPTGEPDYFVSVIQDISRRRNAEEALRLQSAGLNAAADAIVITDPAGVIEWVNPAFTSLTGYRPEEAVGSSLGELVKSGAHDQEFYRQMWETILGGRVWRGETTNRRKDGSLYPEEQSITPVQDAGGAITHFIAVKRDLTGQKQLEAQLLQSQRMDAVGQLAGGVAHDFNNMLGVIAGYTELALSNLDPSDPVHADLREIAKASQRSAALVRQLLAFARRQPIEPRVLDLSDVIASTLKMLARLIGEHIDLVWKPAADLWPVKMDPIQIDQVLANLAVNARDAIQGVGRLTIETHPADIDQAYCTTHPEFTPGRYVRLSVSDDGCGMDEETRARVFEPFFTTKPPGEGTGLGLATVYGIVKQNRGIINVYSEPGHGTTFTIYLPAYEPGIREAAEERAPAPAPTGRETVLLVEDEFALLALGRRMLGQLGYTVIDANTPDQAVELAGAYSGEIHLLMTDVVMPGMSGPDLQQVIATSRPAIKCLYTSGYPSSVIAPRGVLEEGTHFLQKPFSRQALAEKLREALDT